MSDPDASPTLPMRSRAHLTDLQAASALEFLRLAIEATQRAQRSLDQVLELPR